MNLLWAVAASIAVSLISLIGIFAFLMREKILEKILLLLVGFSAGALVGGAFLHLLPEALEESTAAAVFNYVLVGFIFFFILERYFHWRHCHQEHCDVHAFTYLNLIGDGIHNFIDGLVIGASFLVGIKFGVVTTLVIIFHEIPQEIGDFGVLIYGGFTKARALIYNFISATLCIAGTVCGYFLSARLEKFFILIVPVTAGGFIYIAACDLIPEIHRQPGLKRATFSVITFILGILFIWAARFLGGH